MPPQASRIDISATIAVAWVGVALGLTVVFGPQLGARGWLWLGLHHLLCIVGVSHEYRRYQQRQRQRLAVIPSSTPAETPTPDPGGDDVASPPSPPSPPL